MKKLTLYFLLLCIIVISVSGCNSNNIISKKPKNFNFTLNYGINGKNQINTFKGEYTKDMISLPSIVTTLKLSDEEMNEIYMEMKNIDIFSYSYNPFPDDFYKNSNESIVSVTPYRTYIFKINYDGKTKELLWEDEHQSQGIKATKLRSLIIRIQSMVEQKEEYKKLPPAKGAYQ